MSRDPYTYPGTDVLINKFGIKDAEELLRVEMGITDARMGQPMEKTPAMTPEGYQEIHKHIFGDIYPWAGEYRKCEISKGSSAFEYANQIPARMEEVFKNLVAENYLKGLSPDEFSRKAARVLYDLNDTHAFREGNGRAQRLFLEQLAKQARHKLDQSRINPQKWMLGSLESFASGHRGNHATMTEVIRDAIVERNKEEKLTKEEIAEKVAEKMDRMKQIHEKDREHNKGRER